MKRTTLLVLLAVVLVLSLTACLRSASTPPATLPTGDSSEQPTFIFSTATAEGGDPVTAIQTQTAQALNPLPEQNTPEVEVMPTSTPEGSTGQGGEQAQPTATPEAVAVAPTATLAPTPVLERPQTYTLQAGEWPICIARRYGLELGSFLELNGLTLNSRNFSAGDVLKIPATGEWSAAAGSRTLKAHPASHTVAAGESVYSIACAYGDVSPEAILAANGLASASDLKAGATIQIP